MSTYRQNRAIFFATGLDVRSCGLSVEEASEIISDLKNTPIATNLVIERLRERGATGEVREQKAAKWQELYDRAWNAGVERATAHSPTPMHVVQRANPLDDSSPVVKAYAPVMDGMCGFALVNVSPGTSSFARWLVKHGHARKSYYGGVDIWIGEYGQSYERKYEHAKAMASVLQEAGIKAYGMGRLD